MSEVFRMPILRGEKGACFEWEPNERDHFRAMRNHGQTLERLRERGGVNWGELDCILRDVHWDHMQPAALAQASCNAEIENRLQNADAT